MTSLYSLGLPSEYALSEALLMDLGFLVEKAEETARNGSFRQALCELDKLLLEYPDNAGLVYARAKLVVQHCTPPQAIDAASAFCRRFPEDSSGRVLLAYAYLNGNRPTEALSEIECAETNAVASCTHALRVRALVALDRESEARMLAGQYISDGRASLPEVLAFQLAGGSLTKSQMLSYCVSFRASDVYEADVSRFEADWYLTHGDSKSAISSLNRGLNVLPRNSSLLYDLGVAEFDSGQERDGSSRIRQIFKIDPSYTPSAIWLLNFYKRRFNLVGFLIVFSRYLISQASIKVSPN